MNCNAPSRYGLSAALVLLLAASPAFARSLGPKTPPPPKPVRAPEHREPTRPPSRNNTPHAAGTPSAATAPRGHLGQWMENHKSLSLPAQQHALQSEPGFRELPQQVQQRQLTTLGRLYTMDPDQRARVLSRVEGLERLNPQQQQQWGSAVQQLKVVPPPRRRLMTRAIIDLREMPSNQRQQVIDSSDFSAQFSPEERETIRTVLTAY